jgi:hypothetical protein
VPPSFFFEEMPGRQDDTSDKPNPNKELTEFLSCEEGLALNRAFARIRDMRIRRRIVSLVETLAAEG